ncbi:beta-lactamase family protein [Paenibacillus melissococcoides]|uniref:Beta-lactamase family protein n=1 Tax=Paenibacillus melissococcoides TaxID=2912268 RepID=A0ABM9FYH2_9BACL|nr:MULTISPECIES: beta-lactamase family protein [Paenibacillus]MEB9895353.1 serine hydrolase [Bacillus cereus]CAH8244281.1 beta-lactamase family protein [Paenibacillus melissococcoides]CAH8703515.1 beta-lactamase family protein [Paenibacillus melissococcoides]CAH8705932.1 beta-lactamase family protein [Paenibacillus melissococcoides]GIO81541.1 hypothetical protein J6TS7_51510 [Paenibacillus dendritiformis]
MLALAAIMAFGPPAAAKGSDSNGTKPQATRFGPGDLKEVEAFADAFFASDSFRSSGAPGAVVAIVTDNQVLLDKGYGMANAEKRIPMTADTVVRSAMAIGYDSSGEAIAPYAYTPTAAPHGSMHSASRDMTRFMMAHLNGGGLDGHRLLSGAAAKEMRRFQYAIHPKKPNMTYGFEAALHPLHNGRHVIEKALGLFGPDTVPGTDGRIDVRAADPLLRQEAAYMLYHAFQGLYREGGVF